MAKHFKIKLSDATEEIIDGKTLRVKRNVEIKLLVELVELAATRELKPTEIYKYIDFIKKINELKEDEEYITQIEDYEVTYLRTGFALSGEKGRSKIWLQCGEMIAQIGKPQEDKPEEEKPKEITQQ